MMYQSQAGGMRRNLGTGLAVGAVQLGLGIAVVSTFTGGVFTRFIDHPIDARQWAYVPQPKPQPTRAAQVQPHRDDSVITTKSAIDDLPVDHPLVIGPVGPLPPFGADDGHGLIDFTPPHITPPLPPVAAHPLGDTGAWITPNDYPSRALRENWSGVTRFHLVIDADGHVSSCTVTASSGHEALDAVACEKVSQRARFSAARDGAGVAREGGYSGAIRWMIHEE